ncbi:hypothetical protein DNTS_002660 [Danionella cerebrum]|uniref:B30.2/SPRY domain-containing protein n=1 Tax=Danionella cerebrum TaxID=2873325 RepID=A0A553QKN2_9TELE|nr:hypothetical protein DNTS_002660 [Danionella translucida]
MVSPSLSLSLHDSRSQMNLPLVPLVEQECSLSVKMETVEKLVDNLQEVITQNTQRLWSIFRSLNLDPETAHPELEVSGDRLEVHWCKKQTLEKVKISSQYSVLAKERFSTGAHYWEVAVWKKPYWLIGLSYGTPMKSH